MCFQIYWIINKVLNGHRITTYKFRRKKKEKQKRTEYKYKICAPDEGKKN